MENRSIDLLSGTTKVETFIEPIINLTLSRYTCILVNNKIVSNEGRAIFIKKNLYIRDTKSSSTLRRYDNILAKEFKGKVVESSIVLKHFRRMKEALVVEEKKYVEQNNNNSNKSEQKISGVDTTE